MQKNMLPQILCDACKRCRDKELINGHRRRGWCDKGFGWVQLGHTRQCMYYQEKGKDNG